MLRGRCAIDTTDNRIKPRDFEIERPEGQASRVIYAGDVETWERVSTEKVRRSIALCIIGLFAIWVLIGLSVGIATGNVWLLTSAGVLTIPLKFILGYYFRHSKK